MKLLSFLGVALFLLFFHSACSQENRPGSTAEFFLPDNTLEIEGAWARPGRENGVTAIYLHVLNGTAQTDTLIALSSPDAGLAELHETFDRGEGMMGMREAEEPHFPAESVVSMEPGGLHIMLMQLRRGLQAGDEAEVTLTFANAGDIVVTAPVQSPDD